MPLRPSDDPYRGTQVRDFFDSLLPDTEDLRQRVQARFGAHSTTGSCAPSMGHAKNFSLFLLAQGRFRLTPRYDVLSAWWAETAVSPARNSSSTG